MQQRHLIIIKTVNKNRLAFLKGSRDNPYNNQNNYYTTKQTNKKTINNSGKNKQYNIDNNYLRKNIINNQEHQKITNKSVTIYNNSSILSKPE